MSPRPSALWILCLLASPAWAHEFWIQPSVYQAAPGDSVSVQLRIGDGFPGESYPRDRRHIERFVVVGPSGTDAVRGSPRSDPAGRVTVAAEGAYVFAYRSRRSSLRLSGDDFDRYLREEGLDHVLDERRRKGQGKLVGREVFSRCAKALLAVGDGRPRSFEAPVGLPLELVPEGDPSTLSPGGTLTVRLLFEGKPLPGALVKAHRASAPGETVERRTDEEGRVELPLSSTGEWLVNAVHMFEAPAGVDADWESLWASLTFALEPDSAR